MPIAQWEGQALVFNNGVKDVLQNGVSVVDENKIAHITTGGEGKTYTAGNNISISSEGVISFTPAFIPHGYSDPSYLQALDHSEYKYVIDYIEPMEIGSDGSYQFTINDGWEAFLESVKDSGYTFTLWTNDKMFEEVFSTDFTVSGTSLVAQDGSYIYSDGSAQFNNASAAGATGVFGGIELYYEDYSIEWKELVYPVREPLYYNPAGNKLELMYDDVNGGLKLNAFDRLAVKNPVPDSTIADVGKALVGAEEYGEKTYVLAFNTLLNLKSGSTYQYNGDIADEILFYDGLTEGDEFTAQIIIGSDTLDLPLVAHLTSKNTYLQNVSFELPSYPGIACKLYLQYKVSDGTRKVILNLGTSMSHPEAITDLYFEVVQPIDGRSVIGYKAEWGYPQMPLGDALIYDSEGRLAVNYYPSLFYLYNGQLFLKYESASGLSRDESGLRIVCDNTTIRSAPRTHGYHLEVINPVPSFDPDADEGKVLKIVNGVPTWVTP